MSLDFLNNFLDTKGNENCFQENFGLLDFYEITFYLLAHLVNFVYIINHIDNAN